MIANNKIDINFFPNWTRKSVTFTIDDGNIPMDTKFLSIVKPHGILGTFNLNSNNTSTFDAEGYREFYQGYEIANHCKKHPFALDDDNKLEISDQSFDEVISDPTKLYKTDDQGCYYIKKPNGWRMVADTETYIRLADEGRAELENIFGKGNVSSYVWPFCEQNNVQVKNHLKNSGYYGIRKTGCVEDKTAFDMPKDRMAWSYNANHLNLLNIMEKYEAQPDDGKLKFFSFGVHSIDWERADNWNELAEFSDTYGNRPEDYYYATVGDIFAYEDAIKSLEVTDTYIYNPTSVKLYIKINDKRIVLPAKTKFPLD